MKKLIIKLIGGYLDFINLVSKRIGAKHSFYVFCYPFKIKISPAQQKFLDTAVQFKLPMDHFEIQVYKWGNGPKNVVLLHGWSSNSFRWKRYIQGLSKADYTVYAVDAPGHGNSGYKFSNVPLFARALSTLSDHINSIHTLIGHSVGGFASIYFMHTTIDHNIEKFISLAAPGSANDFISLYINALKLSKRTEENLRSYFVTYTGKTVAQFNIEHTMDNMPNQGLIIHDEEDKDVPISYAHKMKSLWPNAELEITKGLGHKLRDKDVIDRVVDFVGE